MKRKAFLKEYFGRFALTLLFLCLIVYTVYHAVGRSSGSLITTPARQVTDTRLVSGTGYLFRDEILLTVPRAGLVNSLAVSGSKAGRNVPLAEVWVGDVPEEELAVRQTELDALNRTIAVLENSLPGTGSSLSEADPARAEALDTLTEIRRAIADGNWNGVPALEDRVLTLLNRYSALTGSTDGINEALRDAKEKRDALLTGERTVLSDPDSSCYYYDRTAVDGYERIFTEDALASLSPESFDVLTASEADAQTPDGAFVVGKKTYSTRWHLAVGLESGTGTLPEEGAVYTVGFPENGGLSLSMTCERLLAGADGRTVAVFLSEDLPNGFLWSRSQTVEIEVGNDRGYYVPDQAFVTVGGTPGVYVLDGSTVRFRRISVLYRGDGYRIAERKETDAGGVPYLALNDLMITSGKNLYDGKVYQ